MAATPSWISRLRGALKSALYSGPARDRWQDPDRVVDTLDLADGDVVVDLGAGGGYFTYRLARQVGPTGRVYAVEPDTDLTQRIERRVRRKSYRNIEVVRPPEGVPPRLPEVVDLVVTVDAFHHLPEERVDYFRQLAHILSPDGRLAVIEPRPKWYLFGHATEAEQIRQVLTEAGYEVAATHDFLDRQSFTVFTHASRGVD